MESWSDRDRLLLALAAGRTEEVEGLVGKLKHSVNLQTLHQQATKEIREEYRKEYDGRNWFDLMIFLAVLLGFCMYLFSLLSYSFASSAAGFAAQGNGPDRDHQLALSIGFGWPAFICSIFAVPCVFEVGFARGRIHAREKELEAAAEAAAKLKLKDGQEQQKPADTESLVDVEVTSETS